MSSTGIDLFCLRFASVASVENTVLMLWLTFASSLALSSAEQCESKWKTFDALDGICESISDSVYTYITLGTLVARIQCRKGVGSERKYYPSNGSKLPPTMCLLSITQFNSMWKRSIMVWVGRCAELSSVHVCVRFLFRCTISHSIERRETRDETQSSLLQHNVHSPPPFSFISTCHSMSWATRHSLLSSVHFIYSPK